jgi:hypothetical protein
VFGIDSHIKRCYIHIKPFEEEDDMYTYYGTGLTVTDAENKAIRDAVISFNSERLENEPAEVRLEIERLREQLNGANPGPINVNNN